MTTPSNPPPDERERVERLLVRLIQGQDAVLHRLDRIRKAIEYTPLVVGLVLVALEVAAWFLRAAATR